MQAFSAYLRYSVDMARFENITYMLILLSLAYISLKPNIPGINPLFGVLVGEFLLLVVISYHLFFRYIKKRMAIVIRGFEINPKTQPKLYKIAMGLFIALWVLCFLLFVGTLYAVIEKKII